MSGIFIISRRTIKRWFDNWAKNGPDSRPIQPRREVMSSISILGTTALFNRQEAPEFERFPDHIRGNTARQKVSLNRSNLGGLKVFQQKNPPNHPHRIAITSLRRGLFLVSLEQEGTVLRTEKPSVLTYRRAKTS